jgi:hypothetical protein
MGLFTFKKSNKNIGDFSATEQEEWTLLIKPEIKGVTTYVHFRKMWLIDEVEEDEENEIAEQRRNSNIEVKRGFIKDGKFVLEKEQTIKARTDEEGQDFFTRNLIMFTEDGFKKDWDNYQDDKAIKPVYYGSNGKAINTEDDLRRFQMMSRPLTPASNTPAGKNPHVILNKIATVSSNNQNQP